MLESSSAAPLSHQRTAELPRCSDGGPSGQLAAARPRTARPGVGPRELPGNARRLAAGSQLSDSSARQLVFSGSGKRIESRAAGPDEQRP
ncbi:unnamed protein product [Gadus morhua 'NCC']